MIFDGQANIINSPITSMIIDNIMILTFNISIDANFSELNLRGYSAQEAISKAINRTDSAFTSNGQTYHIKTIVNVLDDQEAITENDMFGVVWGVNCIRYTARDPLYYGKKGSYWSTTKGSGFNGKSYIYISSLNNHSREQLLETISHETLHPSGLIDYYLGFTDAKGNMKVDAARVGVSRRATMWGGYRSGLEVTPDVSKSLWECQENKQYQTMPPIDPFAPTLGDVGGYAGIPNIVPQPNVRITMG